MASAARASRTADFVIPRTAHLRRAHLGGAAGDGPAARISTKQLCIRVRMSDAPIPAAQASRSKRRLVRAAALLIACWSCASLFGGPSVGKTVERATTRID